MSTAVLETKLDTLSLDGLAPPEPQFADGQMTPHAEAVTCPFSGKVASESEDGEVAKCPVAHAAPEISIQEVDEELLKTSLEDRMVYVKDFIGFGREQHQILNKIAPLVTGMIPQVVDDLYAKLFEFDVTKKIFMKRNQGFDGPLPERLEDLTLDGPQITYRKIFMKSWARRVLTSDYSSGKTWAYMDKVGIMHTGVKSFKHRAHVSPLHVPYRDCALTLGWVQTVLQTAVLQLPDEKLSLPEKIHAIAAISKVIWIQNDLFARHYTGE
ncbi:hypothetical protein Hypma_010721 [Hypsizygus marmoreus]|uniref:Globin-sensor domain-containing protein n=1 Tax=Hypsizygus marmoreus TaxID=39966 RepID=A0A369JR86_HYPMA|nr:hypothetical protein Hypma_010721 [Hypsizygus marmoreus]